MSELGRGTRSKELYANISERRGNTLVRAAIHADRHADRIFATWLTFRTTTPVAANRAAASATTAKTGWARNVGDLLYHIAETLPLPL
jgi:hypothetical protein